MTTTARWNALAWFNDHAVNVNAVMGRRMPTTRMRNLMIREGQLERVSIGAFDHHLFVLTPGGDALLQSKWKRKAVR